MPTDTWLQTAAQYLGGSGLAVAMLLTASVLAIASIVCLIGIWRDMRADQARLQRQLEAAQRRAKVVCRER